MKTVFEQGSFRVFSKVRLDKARSAIQSYQFAQAKTTVFISHKHLNNDECNYKP